MKRNHIITIVATIIFFTTLLFVTGCQEQQIKYEGQIRNVSEVEEIIADKLEVENPELDLEVSITEEQED